MTSVFTQATTLAGTNTGDQTLASLGGAPLLNPTFGGIVQVPTPTLGVYGDVAVSAKWVKDQGYSTGGNNLLPLANTWTGKNTFQGHPTRFGEGDVAWLEALNPSLTNNVTQFSYSSKPGFNIATSAAARTLDAGDGAQLCTSIFLSYVDKPGAQTTGYAVYIEAHLMANAHPQAIASGMEVDIMNHKSITVETNPYNPNAGGLTEGIRLGTNGQTFLGAPISQGIVLCGSGRPGDQRAYDKGIVIAAGSLMTNRGLGEALAMGQGQGISWYTPTGQIGSFIRSDGSTSASAMRQIFADGAVVFQNASGQNIFQITSTGGCYVNGAAIELGGFDSGGPGYRMMRIAN